MRGVLGRLQRGEDLVLKDKVLDAAEEEDEELEEDEEEEDVGVAGLVSSFRAWGVLEELPELRGLMEPKGGDFLLAATPFSRGEDVPLTAGLAEAADS